MRLSRRWLGLIAISLSVALIIADSTIVAVTMPEIVADLGLNSQEVQWVQEAYTLMFASLLLPFGALADRFGRRRMLMIGLVIFGLASIGVIVSTTGAAMIGWRIAQGVGGAMIMPATLSLINANFTGKDRGIAFAVWGGTIGGMAAIGPLLGGWLTTTFSWHWAFGNNPPLVALIIVALLLTVPPSKSSVQRGIDWIGAALSMGFMGLLVFGLIEGRTYGWWAADERHQLNLFGWDWPFEISAVPVAFAISAVLLVLFIERALRRTRHGKSALLDLSLFRIPSFRNGNLVAAIVAMGEFGLILSLPLWMQNVLGYSSVQAGLTLVALAVGSFAASGLVQPLSRSLAPVWIVRIGLLLEILGIVGVALSISSTTAWWQLSGSLAVYGIGVGFATAQLTGTIMVDVPVEQSGQASGTQSTSRQIGSALGIAVLGSMLFGVTATQLSTSAPSGIVDAVGDSAGTAIPALHAQSPELFQAAAEAFSSGARAAAFTAAGALVLALIMSASLGNGRRPEKKPARAHASDGQQG